MPSNSWIIDVHFDWTLSFRTHAQYWKTAATGRDEQKQQNNDLFFLRPNRQQPTNIKYKKKRAATLKCWRTFFYRTAGEINIILFSLLSTPSFFHIFYIFFRFRLVRILLLFYPQERESVEQREQRDLKSVTLTSHVVCLVVLLFLSQVRISSITLEAVCTEYRTTCRHVPYERTWVSHTSRMWNAFPVYLGPLWVENITSISILTNRRLLSCIYYCRIGPK